MIRCRKHTGNIFACQLLGKASGHPIKLRYYGNIRSEESRENTLAGT